MRRFLYSALDNYGGYPFDELFEQVRPVYNPEDLTDTNGALVIWGGGDISPCLYGEKPIELSGAGPNMSSRDQLEVALAAEAMTKGIPIIGICRGAQMMCALSGGKVIQHVDNHGTNHEIHTSDGKTMLTTSLHHQMMFPFEIEHEMLAHSDKRSKHYLGEHGEYKLDIDPEIVWFPRTKALCIQGHPEFVRSKENPFVRHSLTLCEQYVCR